jgi:hypothetical protein
VAILLDERSYGSSPGDDFHPAPYAYVSAHDHDGGHFWNAPFGALRDAGGSVRATTGGFLARGSSVAARDLARAPTGTRGLQ